MKWVDAANDAGFAAAIMTRYVCTRCQMRERPVLISQTHRIWSTDLSGEFFVDWCDALLVRREFVMEALQKVCRKSHPRDSCCFVFSERFPVTFHTTHQIAQVLRRKEVRLQRGGGHKKRHVSLCHL